MDDSPFRFPRFLQANKDALAKAMFLAFSDYDLLSTLRTDAPNYGVKAILDEEEQGSCRLGVGGKCGYRVEQPLLGREF